MLQLHIWGHLVNDKQLPVDITAKFISALNIDYAIQKKVTQKNVTMLNPGACWNKVGAESNPRDKGDSDT